MDRTGAIGAGIGGGGVIVPKPASCTGGAEDDERLPVSVVCTFVQGPLSFRNGFPELCIVHGSTPGCATLGTDFTKLIGGIDAEAATGPAARGKGGGGVFAGVGGVAVV